VYYVRIWLLAGEEGAIAVDGMAGQILSLSEKNLIMAIKRLTVFRRG
jgi:hypothetical protein